MVIFENIYLDLINHYKLDEKVREVLYLHPHFAT